MERQNNNEPELYMRGERNREGKFWAAVLECNPIVNHTSLNHLKSSIGSGDILSGYQTAVTGREGLQANYSKTRSVQPDFLRSILWVKRFVRGGCAMDNGTKRTRQSQ